MSYPIRSLNNGTVSKRLFIGLNISVVLSLALNLNATVLLDIASNGTTTTDPSGNTFGWSFTVGAQNISVAALGVWDQGSDGLNGSHEIGLWNNAGELLACTTIYSGVQSTLQQGFRYENISPVTLTAGNTYYLGANYPIGDTEPVQFSGSYNFQSVLFDQLRYSQNDTLSFPNNGVAMSGFFGPNASLTPVPESGTAGAIVGLGLLAFLVYQRKFSQ